MKAIIVDGETPIRKKIISLLQNVEGINVIKECSSGKSAITEINNLQPDLIFLDVNLKDLSGFEVLKRIEIYPKPLVIFISTHDSHALNAFEFEAFDFLLKPFKEERFYQIIKKVLKSPQVEVSRVFEKQLIDLYNTENRLTEEGTTVSILPIRKGNKTILLKTAKIKYIMASGYYAEIYTKEKKYITRDSLGNLLELLNNDQFFRIHRSAIVNLNHIQEIVHSNYSEIDVRMKDNRLLSVSKSHKKEFLQKLGF